MRSFHILILLSVFVAVIYSYRDYDYQDDYDPRPYRGRRRGGGGGSYGGYGGGSRGGGRGPQYYGFSFGAKGKARTSQTGQGDGHFFGQRARFNGDRIRDRDAEAGGEWNADSLSFGGKGSSRGRTSGDGMLNTWIGGGTGKTNFAHDVSGEAGGRFD